MELASTPTSSATQAAVRRLSPVIMTTFADAAVVERTDGVRPASARRGSWIPITRQLPGQAQTRVGVLVGRASNSCSPSPPRLNEERSTDENAFAVYAGNANEPRIYCT